MNNKVPFTFQARSVLGVGAAVLASSLDRGGFTTRSQSILIVLAGIALLGAAWTDPAGLVATVRRAPLVWALAALGAVAAISAAWTVGRPGDALRAGVVILAYAVLATCAAAGCARVGAAPLVALIGALAVVEALLGLGFDALRSLPDAERIAGVWRPGGTFEYSSALALLEVGVLPAWLTWSGRGGAAGAAAGFGAALAGAVLGCSGSRLAIVIGGVVLVLAVCSPPGGARAGRGRMLLCAIVVLLAGVGAHLILARHAPRGAGGGGLRLAATLGLCLALAAVPVLARGRSVPLAPRVAVLGPLTVTLLAVIVGLAFVGGGHAGGAVRGGGLTHGRVAAWRAAAETWLDRPVLGAGAGTYAIASAAHQGESPVRFAHDLPLELAAELGVPGLLLALALYAAGTQAIWLARGSDPAWLLGPFVAAFLFANLLDWPWHLAGLSGAWAAAAGGLIGSGSVHYPPASSARIRGLSMMMWRRRSPERNGS